MLFWKINKEAELEKPKTIEIEADYMLLFDLGSGAYTAFDWDGADLVDIYDNHEELMEYRAGHVHSHHTMGAYFSGTDQDELHEKAVTGLYLMLVVDNKMTPTAKLAWGGEIEQKIENFITYKWGMFMKERAPISSSEKKEVVYEVELDVEFPDIYDEISDRWDVLVEMRHRQFCKDAVAFKNKASRFKSNGQMGIQGMFGRQSSEEHGNYAYNPKTRTWEREEVEDDTEDGAIDSDVMDFLSNDQSMDKLLGCIIASDSKYKKGFQDAFSEMVNTYVIEFKDINGQEYEDSIASDILKVLTDGDEIVAEFLGQMWIDDASYEKILQSLNERLVGHSGVTAKIMKEVIEAW